MSIIDNIAGLSIGLICFLFAESIVDFNAWQWEYFFKKPYKHKINILVFRGVGICFILMNLLDLINKYLSR